MKKTISILALLFLVLTSNINVAFASKIAIPTSTATPTKPLIQGLTTEQSNNLYLLESYIEDEKWGLAYTMCDIILGGNYGLSDETIAQLKESRNMLYEMYCTITLPIRNAYRDILVDYAFTHLSDYEKPKYYIYDINKDKTPELIIKTGTCEAEYEYTYYTFSNNNAILLGKYPAIHSGLYQYSNGNGIMRIGGAQGYNYISLVELTNEVLSERIIKEGASESFNWDYYNTLYIDECEIIYSTALDNYFGTIKNLDSYDNATKPRQFTRDFFDKELYLECIEAGNVATQYYNLSNTDITAFKVYTYGAEINYNLYLNQQYDTAIANLISTVKSYISQGLYVEAMQICDYVIANASLTDENLQIFNELRWTAQSKYDAYLYKQINSPISDSVKRALWNKSIEIIKGYLYAPLSAIFPCYTEITYYRESTDTIRVNGYYDAQNRFGVYLRGHFTALFSNDLQIISYSGE